MKDLLPFSLNVCNELNTCLSIKIDALVLKWIAKCREVSKFSRVNSFWSDNSQEFYFFRKGRWGEGGFCATLTCHLKGMNVGRYDYPK